MRFRTSTVSLYRSCPVCGSSAVNACDRDDMGKGLIRWLARCGACHTWRMDVLTKRQSRQLMRRLVQDRRHMADALLQLAWADPSRELHALSRPG